MIGFLLTSLALELTPGPNMTYLATLAMARGRVPALQAVAGVALGLLVVGVLAALGVTELLNRLPAAYAVLRYGGVLYMLWLAWDGWTHAGDGPAAHEDFSSFRRGLVVNLLNPKAALFYVAVLPDFIDLARGNVMGQNLTLVLAYVLVACVVHVTIVLFAVELRASLLSRLGMQIIARGLALVLVGVAFWMFWETGA